MVDVAEVQRLARKIEALENESLRLAVPLPHAEPFHACTKPVVLADGANQAAKTFHVELECARALTGQDPYNKYPKRDGRAVFVGYDDDHLSDPMYLKLFEPGEFKVIPDEHTGKLRAVRPDPNDPRHLDPYDEAYREKWQDAPPLIPPRFVKEHAWKHQAKRIPRRTTLTTGWTILWRSSKGKPPRGIQVDLIWADEEIDQSELWVNELIPRLLRRGGRFIWSANPEYGGVELYEYRQKADAGSPYIGAFTFVIDDNPYISDADKQKFRDLLTTEEQVSVRYYGQYLYGKRRIYPMYDPMGIHGCEPFDIPASWARYVILDPGTQHCATLLVAVDPEERHRWVYDGFDLEHAAPSVWAGRTKTYEGSHRFEAFVIDQRMGRQTTVGATRNVAQQYWQAAQEANLIPRTQGPLAGFYPGSDNIPAREKALIGWMTVRGTGPFAGTPVLQVFRGMIPELDRQIRRMQHPRPVRDKKPGDLATDLEYTAGFNPGYFRPEPVDAPTAEEERTPYQNFQAKKKKQRAQRRRNLLTTTIL